MNSFNSIYRLMTKRYGMDELNKLLFIIYIICFVISIFVRNFFLDIFNIFLLFIIIYRFCSKNISKRSKENKVILNIKSSILKLFRLDKKYKNNNQYIYKKCRDCHTILRLPLPATRGIKHAKCPQCKKRLTIICLRKQKVEVIRKEDIKC